MGTPCSAAGHWATSWSTDLSVRRREPRSAIEATARDSIPAHCVAGCGAPRARYRRAPPAGPHPSRVSRSEPEGLGTIMLGDFNDWFSIRPVRKTLAAVLPEQTSLKTFPAVRPILKLDRILFEA